MHGIEETGRTYAIVTFLTSLWGYCRINIYVLDIPVHDVWGQAFKTGYGTMPGGFYGEAKFGLIFSY